MWGQTPAGKWVRLIAIQDHPPRLRLEVHRLSNVAFAILRHAPTAFRNGHPVSLRLLPVHVTELGVIQMATAGDAVDFGRLAELTRSQIDGYRALPWVDSFAIWNVGCCVGWIDLTSQLVRFESVF